jgi:Rrf2 family protein
LAITKKAEYAIAALADLASRKPEGFESSRDIATRQGIPPKLIAQILALMSKGGILEGARGPLGGVRLIRDPSTISLREVIELVEGPLGITKCLVQRGECRKQGSCPLQGIWAEAQERMVEVLEGRTIQDLADAQSSMASKSRPER